MFVEELEDREDDCGRVEEGCFDLGLTKGVSSSSDREGEKDGRTFRLRRLAGGAMPKIEQFSSSSVRALLRE